MKTLVNKQSVSWQTVCGGILLAVLLVAFAYVNLYMRRENQLWVLMACMSTIFVLYRRIRVFFFVIYILLTVLVYTSLLVSLYNLLNPEHGWVVVSGARHRVMETAWMPAMVVGFILAAFTSKFYEKHKDHRLEMLFASGLFVIAVVIGVGRAY